MKFYDKIRELLEKYYPDDYYISNSTKGNLINYLKEYDDDKLNDLIYLYLDDDKLKNKSKGEKIKLLDNAIKENFNKIFYKLSFFNIISLDKMINNKEIDSFGHQYVLLGLAFLSKNDEVSIPLDIKKMYEEKFGLEDKKKLFIEEVKKLGHVLFMNFAIVKESILLSFYDDNFYNLITKNELEDNLKEDFKFYKINGETYLLDKYCDLEIDEENFKDIIYFKRSYDDYTKYYDEIRDALEEISEVIIGKLAITYELAIMVLDKPKEVSDILDEMKEYYKLDNKKLEEISNILYEIFPNIRFWGYGGKTIDEKALDLFILDKEPKNDSYTSLLNLLSSDAIEYLSDNYSFDSKAELEDILLTYFKDFYLKELEENDLVVDLLSYNFKEFEMNSFLTNGVLNGLIFLYKEDNKIKVYLPREVIGLLEEAMGGVINLNNIGNPDSPLILSYIAINGVIDKNVLKELLLKNNNLDFSIDELDDVVNNSEFYVFDNYYCTDRDLTELVDQGILSIKKSFGKYKKLDETLNLNVEFIYALKQELENYFTSINVNEVKQSYCIGTIIFMICTNAYNKDDFIYTCKSNGLSLTNNQYNNITNIINKYRNDIPMWTYNGYTKNEVNSMPKEKKVGRNDPCPCGSGKKYKKCCGK